MTITRSRGPDRDRERSQHLRIPQPPGEHPSFLALDRAALGSRTDALSRHLAGCERCSGHVESIALAAAAPDMPRLARAAAPRGRPLRHRPARAWLSAATAAATVAIVVVAWLGRGRDDGVDRGDRSDGRPTERVATPAARASGFDTRKGARAVGVYVLRGRRTFLWNGSEPIAPGDTIRLKLVPEQMTQVHVFSVTGPGGNLVLLHRADIAPGRDAPLGTAWKVDAAGDREVLIVVLSARRLSLARAEAAARSGGMGDEIWVTRLALPKRPSSDMEVLP
jgi:hypothetical protein